MTNKRYGTVIQLLLGCGVGLCFATPAFARDQVKIVGSSTVYPFAAVVAERVGRAGKMKTPVVESTGTGGGMKQFCQGVGEAYPDITNASRKIKASELNDCIANGVSEVIEITVGNDGIVFANRVASKKLNFTREQLWKAMAARGPKPQKWNEIDPSLPDAQITIFTPPPTSGTRDAWNELVMEKGCDPEVKQTDKAACALMREDGPVVEAGENDALLVQKLQANGEAFAIFGFSYLDNNADRIQSATIEGKEPGLSSIQSYDYPLARPLFFYVKKAHIGVVPGIKEYLEEFTSQAAMSDDGYLSDVGLVPLDDKMKKEVRDTATSLKTLSE